METIMRTAWLPVLLILLTQMVSIFLTFSLAIDRPITLAQVGSFAQAKALLPQFQVILFVSKPYTFWAITIGTFLLTLILLASFIAPLIRDAATGEKPAQGVIHLPFGSGELRFSAASLISGLIPLLLVFAPVFYGVRSLTAFVSGLLEKGDSVIFPLEQSIHTVRPTQLGDLLAGPSKLFVLGVPVPVWLFATPFLLILMVLMHQHFRPDNRAESLSFGSDQRAAGKAHPLRRLLVVIAGLTAFVGLTWVSMIDAYQLPGILGRLSPSITIPEAIRPAGFVVYSILILFLYISVRIFPYPGYAVMDRSMRFKDVLRATRGWNLFRMLGLIVLLTLVVGGVSIIVDIFAGVILPMSLSSAAGLMASGTRLFNSGVMADWVLPVLIWTWNIARLLINIFMMFFSYGVLAGLYGRLYAQAKMGEPYMPAR